MKNTNKTLSILVIVSYLIDFYSCQMDYSSLFNSKSWGCNNGKRQSPIAIEVLQANYTSTISIAGEDYSPINNGVLYFNKATSQIEFSTLANAISGTQGNYGSLYIIYNGYEMKYDLSTIHLHSRAHHSIDGDFGDFELQLIHRKDLNYHSNVNNFKQLPDISRTLTVTIPYKLNASNGITDNGLLQTISGLFADITQSSVKTASSINLNDFNLVNNRTFFFYSGSDTYFPCNEDTLHFVIKDYSLLTTAVQAQLTTIMKSQYKGGNVKPLALLQGRFYYRNFFISEAEQKSFEGPSIANLNQLKIDRAIKESG